MVFPIKLTSTSDVRKLNDLAFKMGKKVSVSSGSVMTDARSLLGLFYFINRSAYLVAPDHSNPNDFLKLLSEIGILDAK